MRSLGHMLPAVKCLHSLSSRHVKCITSIDNISFHKFPQEATSCTFLGKKVYIIVECHICTSVLNEFFLFAAKESTDFDTFLNQKVKSSLLKGLTSCVWRGWSHDSSLDIVSSEHIFVVSYNKAYVHHYCIM